MSRETKEQINEKNAELEGMLKIRDRQMAKVEAHLHMMELTMEAIRKEMMDLTMDAIRKELAGPEK